MKITPIYTKSILFCKVTLHIGDINGKKSICQLLTDKIIQMSGNKCIEDGYVSSHDIQILSYSTGLIQLDSITTKFRTNAILLFQLKECSIMQKLNQLQNNKSNLIQQKCRQIIHQGNAS